MGVLISPRRRLAMDTFGDALGDPDPWEGPAVVDLSRCEFIDAYAIAGMASVIATRMREYEDVDVITPNNSNCANYLSRMRFQDFLDEHAVPADRRLPPVSHYDHRGFLVELTRFDDENGSDAIANVVFDRLAGNVENGVTRGMHESAAELGLNVSEHADSPSGGYAAAQTYRRGMGDERLLIAVADAGRGLAATLGRRYGQLSDYLAVRMALERDVTGTDEPGRGQGLADIVQFTRTYGGFVTAHSGRARRLVYQRLSRTRNASHLRGTLIGAQVPCRP